jgi:hypothetical protein
MQVGGKAQGAVGAEVREKKKVQREMLGLFLHQPDVIVDHGWIGKKSF